MAFAAGHEAQNALYPAYAIYVEVKMGCGHVTNQTV